MKKKTHKNWKTSEINQVVRLRKQGWELRKIAEVMNRPYESIVWKLHQLGVKREERSGIQTSIQEISI